VSGAYRTIVADPPWEYPGGWPGASTSARSAARGNPVAAVGEQTRTAIKYPTLPVAAIAALPVGVLAHPAGAHLYLWTTNRYLHDAFHVAEAWGFRYGQLLTWCKAPMGLGPGGAFAQSSEYVLFCRRGHLRHLSRVDSTWFNWPRLGRAHSRKPEAFLDLVEQVSPGPYLEMFARRSRLGWDVWGNEVGAHEAAATVLGAPA
jgi:N6-adenosine-specific RNA methylase IME4